MAKKVVASTRARPLVAIGSKNRAKVEGARRAFERSFKDVELKVLDLTAMVKIQPMSLDETVDGARRRAEFAIKEEKGADFGVGVEAGIVELIGADEDGNGEGKKKGFFLNLQVAAIVDSAHRLSFGSSSGFPIPPNLISMLGGGRVELDRFAQELTGAKRRIREEDGIIYHLSKRHLSRVEMTEQCVSMALIPWLNKRAFKFG